MIRTRTTYLLSRLFALILISAGGDIPAHSSQIGLDANTFLKDSSRRSNNSASLFINPDFKTEGKKFEARADVQAVVLVNDYQSITPEANQLYVATSRNFSKFHQIALGRVRKDWSIVDDVWNLGMWEPRFVWDPMYPEKIGLTGLFYHYRSSQWSVQGFGSALSIPERGFPFAQNNRGQITSPSPFHVPLKETAWIEGQPYPIGYELNMPEASKFLFRPSAAVRIRYGQDDGLWVSSAYGYLPIHQTDILVNAGFNPLNQTVETELNPRFLSHHLVSFETGYRSSDWSMWATAMGDLPQVPQAPEGTFDSGVGNAVVASWGGAINWSEGLKVSTSYLGIFENIQKQNTDDSIEIDLPDRYNYRNALRVAVDWEGFGPLSYDASWIYDTKNVSNLFGLNVHIQLPNAKWRADLGADFITSATGKGWIGQYSGDDRVRGRLTYAF